MGRGEAGQAELGLSACWPGYDRLTEHTERRVTQVNHFLLHSAKYLIGFQQNDRDLQSSGRHLLGAFFWLRLDS